MAISVKGTQTALAAAIDPKIKTGHIYYWLESGKVPPEYAPVIERETRVQCEALCPDVSWHRVKDKAWPWHPKGRPLIDVAAAV